MRRIVCGTRADSTDPGPADTGPSRRRRQLVVPGWHLGVPFVEHRAVPRPVQRVDQNSAGERGSLRPRNRRLLLRRKLLLLPARRRADACAAAGAGNVRRLHGQG